MDSFRGCRNLFLRSTEMKNIFNIPLILTISLPILCGSTACREIETFDDDPYGNFDCLWQTVSDHYCFFSEKNIDWKSIGESYRQRLTPQTKWPELYNVCASMLNELEDGHVNLITPFSTSAYRKWWTDYPQDFNLRTVQEYYLNFKYLQTSGITYSELGEDGEVGYIYYPSFSAQIGETNLDYILAVLSHTKGLIIDIRNNGGGYLTNINTLVGRFIESEFTGGYISHKTGPGPGDFSEPFAMKYKPAHKDRVRYLDKPVVILINRSCFSAANNFAAVMKELPQVVLLGAKTGGGGGLPFSAEIPNGWSVRFSACPVTDVRGQSIEQGVDPTPGFEVHASDEELANGRDAILDAAIELISH